MDYNVLHWWMCGRGQHCITINVETMYEIFFGKRSNNEKVVQCGLVDVRTWTTLYYNQCMKPCMKFFLVGDLIMKRLSSVVNFGKVVIHLICTDQFLMGRL